MSIQVTMPALGESVTEGTVTRWLKNVGDTVAVDEPLLEVSTDKVDTEIPAPVAGILLEIRAEVDATVPVGSVVAVIGEPGSAAPAPVAAQAAPVAPAPAPAPAQAAPVASTPAPATAAAPAAGTPILLPALGESVTEGTVTRWLKSVGDNVTADEPLLEVSTDKVDTEIPAPASGVLLSIDVPADATAPVGAVLGVIGSSAAAPAAPAPAAPAPAAPASAPVVSAPVAPAAPSAPIAPVSDAYVTPLVRKVAADLGVDLSTVAGTGVGGRIRKQDVEAAAARLAAPAVAAVAPAVVQAAPTAPAATAAPAAALRGRTEPLSRLRKVIAQRMVESLQVSAQLTSVAEVDVTSIVNLRNRNKRAFEDREGVGLSFMPFFLKGLVDVLKVHPVLNSTLDLAAGTVTYHDAEHLAIAVDTPRGLVVPVIRDAGDLSLAGLARKVADLAERTRAGQVSPDELSGGTFTLTNTGSRGALMDTPIINQPQVAILGLGQIVKRPVVITDADGNDVIAIRHMVFLSLTYDHRIVDGADAARFLTDLKARYEQGAFDL